MGTAGALAVVIGVAILTALIALPLALRRVPRNRLYGVRTRRTLTDDRVWYETNAYGGRGRPGGRAALAVPSLAASIPAVRHAGRISRREE